MHIYERPMTRRRLLASMGAGAVMIAATAVRPAPARATEKLDSATPVAGIPHDTLVGLL